MLGTMANQEGAHHQWFKHRVSGVGEGGRPRGDNENGDENRKGESVNSARKEKQIKTFAKPSGGAGTACVRKARFLKAAKGGKLSKQKREPGG